MSAKSSKQSTKPNIRTGVVLPSKMEDPSADWILKKMAGMSTNEILTPDRKKELVKCALSYGGAFAGLIVTAVTIYIASTDDKALTKSFFTYMICMVLPILVGIYLALPIFKTKASGGKLIVNSVIFVIMVGAIYKFYNNKNPASMLMVKYLIYVGAFFSIIVGLALGYKIMGRFVYNSRGVYGVLFQLIMFLPCLLLDFIDYVKEELKIAPNSVYILLVIEAVLLLAMYFIPKLVKPRQSKSTTTLLDTPVFLNNNLQIADHKVLTLFDTDANPFLQNVMYRTNYSISFWAYLNPKGNVALPILRLGTYAEPGGKPLIRYANGKYVFQFTNTPESVDKPPPSYEVDLPSQKWNFFVITYDNNAVDLFVNGNLEKTFSKISVPTYGPGDVIEVGNNPIADQGGIEGVDYSSSNTTGVSGAICNVNYHRTILTQRQIITEYNLLMFKNPPTKG